MATIKQLLKRPLEELEAMTPEQLKEYCAPFLRYIELKKKPEAETEEIGGDGAPRQLDLEAGRKRRKKEKENNWQHEAARLAKLHNIPMPTLPKELK